MKNLLHFILKHVHWLLFFLLGSVSLYLLQHNSEFQRSKFLAGFQEITGRVYYVSQTVQSYMNLRTANADLMQRNAFLEEEIYRYQKEIEILTDEKRPKTIELGSDYTPYIYMYARVVRNQIFGPENYILLDKGSKDGVKEDMAVVSVKGIVGVVMNVSSNFARVIPVLNSQYHPSCKIKNTNFFGSLFWDGKDPRYISLSNLPSHASYNIGDTIVTSGYSATFPKGVLVGVIETSYKQTNNEYNSLKVRLFTDFSTLNEVHVIQNPLREELINIEKGVSAE